MLYFVDTLEKDAVYEYVHNVPFHMCRYNLYVDSVVYEREQFFKNKAMLNLIDGNHSMIEIAGQLNIAFEEVSGYFERMVKENLIRQCGKWIRKL